MGFRKVQFYNFRNIKTAKIELTKKNIVLIGNNGQGKSNFLEAMYILSYGSSFRTKKDQNLVTFEKNEASILGNYVSEDANLDVRFEIQNNKKSIKVDNKLIQDRTELFGQIPSIIFCHEDIQFVTQGPEFQRQYINQCGSLWRDDYISCLRDYTKILKERNFLLKTKSTEMLDTYTQQLIAHGILLYKMRQEIVDQVNSILKVTINEVNEDLAQTRLQYEPSWKQTDIAGLEHHYQSLRSVELKYGTSLIGPHRDKFVFYLSDKEFTAVASTGQVRVLSLVLRLVQAITVSELKKNPPILLLDDVLLELDPERRENFTKLLPEYNQTIYTFLPNIDPQSLLSDDVQVIEVEGGNFVEKHR